MRYSANLNVILEALNKANRLLLRDFWELANLQNSSKTLEFAKKTYQKIEKHLISDLKNARPNYGIIISETNIEENNYIFNWIIEPIAGVKNFAHAVPFFAVAIALQREGETLISAVSMPITREIFYAEKNSGAWLEEGSIGGRSGNLRLRVSRRDNLDESIISSNIVNADIAKFFSSTGSFIIDLTYIAAGRYDCGIYRNMNFIDKSITAALIKESGGIAKIHGDIMAIGNANTSLYLDKILKLI